MINIVQIQEKEAEIKKWRIKILRTAVLVDTNLANMILILNTTSKTFNLCIPSEFKKSKTTSINKLKLTKMKKC